MLVTIETLNTEITSQKTFYGTEIKRLVGFRQKVMEVKTLT